MQSLMKALMQQAKHGFDVLVFPKVLSRIFSQVYDVLQIQKHAPVKKPNIYSKSLETNIIKIILTTIYLTTFALQIILIFDQF